METLPPFLFPADTQSERRWMAKLKAARRIRKIGPRLHTSLPESAVAIATRGAWATIASALFPGALVSHRTALEMMPSPESVIFLTAGTNRRVEYPGLTIQFVRGPAPLDDDRPFLALRTSSLARALLENLRPEAGSHTPRTVSPDTIERRLEQLLQTEGERELNRVRDRAAAIARAFDWSPAFDRLNSMIGALLGTRAAANLSSSVARARAAGEPFDPACVGRLQVLLAELSARSLPSPPDVASSPDHVRNKAFFEAYFSNFIEGTRFEIAEAEEIVFDEKVPAERPVDAHDIVGTFELVADPDEMRRTPASHEGLLELLRRRHGTMLARRPEAHPGRLKERENRAGSTLFVHPDLVVGTLREGFGRYESLQPGLPRAIFMLFLITDVHPFVDGNGRVARIFMNAEMTAAGAATIVVPTVFRDDYMTALNAMTRRERPGPLVDALARAAAFSRLDFARYPTILAELRRRNWFEEPDMAKILTAPLPA